MRKTHWAALCLAAFAASPALAVSPFDGTWKVDLASAQLDPKPDVFAISDGMFSCPSCTPPVSVKADGQPHPVAGRDYSDTMSVKVVDAHTVVMTSFKGGKTVGMRTTTVSPDGQTLTMTFKGTNLATGATTTGQGHSTRIAAGPAGAHLISGSWRPEPLDTLSDTGTMLTLAVTGDTLTLSDPGGVGYTARFGGPAVAEKGDSANTMVSVAMPAADTIVETDVRGGRIVEVFTMKLAADGKSLALTDDDRKSGAINHFTANKQ